MHAFDKVCISLPRSGFGNPHFFYFAKEVSLRLGNPHFFYFVLRTYPLRDVVASKMGKKEEIVMLVIGCEMRCGDGFWEQ